MRTVVLSALLLATSVTTIVNSTPILSDSHRGSDIQVGSPSVTSTLSTSSAKPPSDDAESESTENGQATVATTASTTPPESEDTTQGSNDTITTPEDADPYDCKNATQEGHIFLTCEYGCGGDEMLLALNNATCYLNPPNVTTELLLNKMDNHTQPNTNETGVCFNGVCVPRLTSAPASPTQSSPDQSGTTPTGEEIETEDQTQDSNDTFTTPADADPSDCKNATQKDHIFLTCQYGCGGDEMLTAMDNATCYLYPPNVTTAILLSGLYNYTEQHTNKTGVCLHGECVSTPDGTTAATTESSPARTTSPETANETQSPIDEQPSVVTEKPNDLSESSSESLPPQTTSA